MKIFLSVVVVISFLWKAYSIEISETWNKHPYWCIFFGYWIVVGTLLWLAAINNTENRGLQKSENS